MLFTGTCCCGEVHYELNLGSPEEARTSICYCENCRVGTSRLDINCSLEVYLTCPYAKEQAAEMLRYINYGTPNQREAFPSKGEFFCKYKEWMPEILSE
ncbi:hypothetical protein AN958_01796 [Leucoagaricus sp. SymC.cos]|nr:hypothetical protein AN958_01796 [Leucoagaricus sp. SymC.cos]